ncbi:MAG TPA: SDR family oxidoreductase [Ignavibacteria bacterium]|nr:SDR family oxidoreductase [Ignavibacteria bacterium]HQY52055.1 SDR family oxidoreductase [Ignavibacteria bacterium]HRA99538.1 SDR family oxidoreductase [Ignavibacteria bacterium]
MNIDLKNKKAIVCGSTQGIGKAIAIELASSGASVILISRNEDSLREVLRELPAAKDQNHNFIVADFSDPDSLKEKMHNFISESSPVHILVNNTGGPKGGEAIAADTSEYLQAFSNHLICNQILVQAVVEGMKKEGYGRIVNIISTSVKQPLKNLGVSNTIRGAVASWAKTLAGELGPFGITVNNVLPGATKTVRLKSIIENKSKISGKTIEEVTKEMLKEIPVGKFAEPEELAYAVTFLASSLAGSINGINLPVDGGRTGCL